MHLFIYQIKQAYLSLKQKPGFVFSVVSTMGITLGALMCVLTLAYVMLFKPLPYPEQDRLYSVSHEYTNADGKKDAVGFSYPNIINLYNNQTVFTEAALIGSYENVLTSLPNLPKVRTTYVTPEWFTLLAAPLVLGRSFEQTEALDTFNPVAVISYKTWLNEFNKNPEILSKKVTVLGVSFRIIGVLAESFIEPQSRGAGVNTAIWFPWDYNNDSYQKNHWSDISSDLAFLGKLKPKLSITQAEEKTSQLVNSTWQQHVVGIEFFKGFTIHLHNESLQKTIIGDSQLTVTLLFLGALGLVIIAVSNIANLYISRSIEQKRNLAIHASLGIKKSAMFKRLLIEAAMLMTSSIIVALFFASLGFSIMEHYLSSLLPRLDELCLQEESYIFAMLLTALLSVGFAWFNNKFVNYQSLNTMLISSGKGVGEQVSKRSRQLLIFCQVTIATILVFANAALFKVSLDTITTPLNYQVENTHYLRVSVVSPSEYDWDKHGQMMAAFRKKLTHLPQVLLVSKSESPLDTFDISAITDIVSKENFGMKMKNIDHNYFLLIEQPLLEGNYFSDNLNQSSMEVIINDVFAEKIAPNSSALGMKLELGGDGLATIIGIVKGIKLPGESVVPMRFYDVLAPDSNVLIKLKEGQVLPRHHLNKLLKEVSNKYAVLSYENLSETKEQLLFTEKTTLLITAILTLFTLLLSAIGLYGILSYSTQTRRFEIGTRMAIGAKGRDIVALTFKDNVGALLIGIAVSILVLLGLYLGFSEQLIQHINFALIPLFISTLLLILLVSFFACYLPLRQYIKQPVMHSLRGSD